MNTHKKISINRNQAKLVLKSLREIEDRLNVVCRISDDDKEIRTSEKQLKELAKLIKDISQQDESISVKKSVKRESVIE